VVIDTNVVVSALLFGGTPGMLHSMWQSGRLVPFISEPILDEYLQVLAYPRFELTEKEIEFLVYRQILPYFEVVTVAGDTPVIAADPSDDKFLHCAVAAKADALVSGDRHLLNLASYRKIPILSAATLLKKISD
jgi:putative PIN family toxin of toxin-antitoxin system